mmetsp:Transcript_1304/g.4024  ORF Transcript_1304/g.4024 Transcript_1304/m.4024 type:complete len:122 (-) Transcript_1304:249-614(-)
MHKSLLLLSLLSGCAALVVSPARASPAAASRCAAPTALAPVDASAVHSVASLVAEIVQADGERAYGAVDAPLWVLPVGAIAVIATALVPILLSPGEEAFNQQQGYEQGRFGTKDGINRPRK